MLNQYTIGSSYKIVTCRALTGKGKSVEKVSMSHEDYLEAIVMLGGSPTQPVRSVDIAAKLGVSKASVSKAVTSLKASGMLEQPYYGDITLTEDGYHYGASVAFLRKLPKRKHVKWNMLLAMSRLKNGSPILIASVCSCCSCSRLSCDRSRL